MPRPGPRCGDLHGRLAEILAIEERDKSRRRIVDSLDDRFAILELARGEALREARQRFTVAVLPVEHDHPLQPEAIDQHRAHVAVPVGLGEAVLRDQAADDDAPEEVRERQQRIEDLGADVFEANVHPAGARFAQPLGEVTGLVVDAGVVAQLLHRVIALRLAAGDADHAAAFDLHQLACDATHRAARGGYDDRLALLRLADFKEPEPRGDPGHAKHSQVVRRGNAAYLEPREVARLRHAVELPSERRQHLVPGLEARVPRFDDLAHRLPDHDRVDLHRRRVGFRVAHAPAHVRIEREPLVLHQHFARPGRSHRLLVDAEILWRDRALGPAGEKHLLVHWHAAKRSRWWSASPNCCAIIVRRRKVWLTLSSSVIPMPPCSWTDSWLTWRQASAIRIFAADTMRLRSIGFFSASTRAQARLAMDLACS